MLGLENHSGDFLIRLEKFFNLPFELYLIILHARRPEWSQQIDFLVSTTVYPKENETSLLARKFLKFLSFRGQIVSKFFLLTPFFRIWYAMQDCWCLFLK